MNADEAQLILKQGREGLTLAELARLQHLRDKQAKEEAEAESQCESWHREAMDCIERDAAMREERQREGGR